MTVAGMLGLIAAVALNIWLFRQGPLWGILGLNVSKHVLIAYLCQSAGVNRRSAPARSAVVVARADRLEDGSSART